jgi:YaiO family outer membrane protein
VQVSPQETLAQARAFEAAKQYEQAMAGYRAYLEARPEDDEVRGTLARVLSWQGAYDEAVALYEDILTRHPGDRDVRTALARVKSWQQKFAEARRLYEGVLRQEAQNLDARRGLADTLYWSGDYAAALQQYEALFAATADSEVATRIQAVQAELARVTERRSPGAPIGQATPALSLPYRDYLKLGYSYFNYTRNLADEQDGLVEAAKSLGTRTLIGRVEVLDRFGLRDAAVSGELYSPLWERAWGYLGASVGIDPDFVPQWTLGGEVFQGLGVLHPVLSFLELSVGYRHLRFRTTDVDLVIPGLTIYFPHNVWLTEKVFYVPDTDSVTLSSQLTWRVTSRLQLSAAVSFGTAGERISALEDIRHVTTRIVQGGLTFPLTRRFSAEVWAYYEDRKTLYVRRGGTFNLLFHW